MSQNLMLHLTPQERLKNAVQALQAGKGVLVIDDENRENEGDLIFSVTHLTEKQMAMLIRECSGIVCLCMPPEKAESLNLKPMVDINTSRYGTAFTVSIEASEGVTTGVSAQDRVTTIKAATSEKAIPEDIRSPGHVFPLVARKNGVLEREGHTEATVDLMRLSGLPPYGVLCELTNADGTMARLPEILSFSEKHDFPVVSVKDIISYKSREDMVVNS